MSQRGRGWVLGRRHCRRRLCPAALPVLCAHALPASILLLLQMLYFKKVGGLDTKGGVMWCCKGTPVGGGGAAAPLESNLWLPLLLSSAEPSQQRRALSGRAQQSWWP